MKRPKLVDYSDSEGESTDPPRPVVWSSERPRPPEPQDANELAQIVIQLQQHYTKEVSDLEHQQEEMERRLGAWKAQIEDRLQLQVNVMASIIKASSLMGHGHIHPRANRSSANTDWWQEVFGVDATNPATRKTTQQSDKGNGHVVSLVPPSPSPVSPALLEPSVRPTVPLAQHRNTSRVTLPVHVREARPEPPARNGEGERQPPTTHPSPSLVRRSTGKKVPRPRPVGANRRPYEPARKPRNKASGTSRAKAVKTGQVMATGDPDEPHETTKPTTGAGAKDSLQPPTDGQAAPFNPYDDPKYFSTLTFVDEDGMRRPIFQFHRHPATVEEQWAEFRHGLHGQPPVERLEALYRAKWRNSTYGRSWFTRRKAFWDRVKEMLAEGRTEGQALEVMRRRAEGTGGGVPSLIAQLCRERGHGSRPDRRRDRPRSPGRKRGVGVGCDDDGDVDSGRESDEFSGTGRSSPLRPRKRVKVSAAGKERDDDEGSADGMDEAVDGLWVG